jgi:hypothetical protein
MAIRLGSEQKGDGKSSNRNLRLLMFVILPLLALFSITSLFTIQTEMRRDETMAVDHPIVASSTSLGQSDHADKPTATVQRNKGSIIIGFSDFGYKEIAWKWYQELEKLGYDQHLVAAQDRVSAEFFKEKGMRYDLVHPSSNSSLRDECTDYYKQFNSAKKLQTYRRSLFGSRWNYVVRQLELGHHVLLTDVDNVFVRYAPLSELEDSPYDAYHAYAGAPPSFPLNIYYKAGFTICGGMSWLRSTPGVIEFAQTIVNRCNCETLVCNCNCDDQVVINTLISLEEYKIAWDHPVVKPNSEADMSWEGMTGTCTKTGHRVKIWDRHTAYRNTFDPQKCPNEKNWIAMPTDVDKSTVWETWSEACVKNSSYVKSSGMDSIAR